MKSIIFEGMESRDLMKEKHIHGHLNSWTLSLCVHLHWW